GSTFFWQPGNQTSQTITATNTGTYQVQITATNGCTNSESVYLKLNSIVKPKLGKDTTVCGGLILNAGYPGSLYQWNTGDSTQQINISNSGRFVVNVVDINNCQGADTIDVMVKINPALNLGPDLNICKPKSGLNLIASSTTSNLVWSTGASSGSIH